MSAEQPKQGAPSPGRIMEFAVITSYSIHYTKLYEAILRPPDVAGHRGGSHARIADPDRGRQYPAPLLRDGRLLLQPGSYNFV